MVVHKAQNIRKFEQDIALCHSCIHSLTSFLGLQPWLEVTSMNLTK